MPSAGIASSSCACQLKRRAIALDLADAVIDATKETPNFEFLYPLEMPLKDRVGVIAKEIYGADGPSAKLRAPRA